MAQPRRFASLNGTPQSVAGGAVVRIETIEAHNPSESAGAYVKIWGGFAAAPTSTDVPNWEGWVGPGATGSGGHRETFAPFIGGARFWIAAAITAGAGISNPASAFDVTITTSP